MTTPLDVTVATAALPVVHVTTRPDSGFPLASSGVAVSVVVWPAATLTVAGLTRTEATGTVVTVTLAVPLTLPLAAVIVADPWATPVTTPLGETVASAALLVVQVTVRPETGLPLASSGVAMSGAVCPTVTVAVAGLTTTEATVAGTTVIVADPAWPPLEAVIVADPWVIPVTTPPGDTLTTDAFPVVHVTVRPANGLPLASSGVAMSGAVCPTVTVAVAGLTTTEATVAGTTVIVADPAWPPLEAVMVADPWVTPVTTPPGDTLATDAFPVVHVTVRPANGLPLASSGVAVSVVVCPAMTLAVAGVSATDATGTAVTATVSVAV